MGRPWPSSHYIHNSELWITYALRIDGKITFPIPKRFCIITTCMTNNVQIKQKIAEANSIYSL